MTLEELIVWATTPFGLVVLGLGAAILVGLEMLLLFGVFRRVGRPKDRSRKD